jgi:parallel beta-helix repeat protein
VRVYGSSNVTIENNDFTNAEGWGVSIQINANDAKVIGNRISGTIHEHGVYVSGSRSDRVHAPIMQGNVVTGSAYDGIKLTYTDDAVVANNVTFNNGGEGIYVTVGTHRADVHDNFAHSNSKVGILIFDGTSSSVENRIHNNVIRANLGPGIAISSAGSGAVSGTSVEDNDVEDNDLEDAGGSGYGIVVSGGITTSQTVVEGNRIRKQDVGIYVGDGTRAVIGGNEFENCRIRITDSSANAGG